MMFVLHQKCIAIVNIFVNIENIKSEENFFTQKSKKIFICQNTTTH